MDFQSGTKPALTPSPSRGRGGASERYAELVDDGL